LRRRHPPRAAVSKTPTTLRFCWGFLFPNGKNYLFYTLDRVLLHIDSGMADMRERE
jgi:hypothetical protein